MSWCTASDIKANPEKFWSFSFKKQSPAPSSLVQKALALRAAGSSLASIAIALDVSLSTVKRYVKSGEGL
ncbi:helix-turn-helix domain-containing protein [Rhizobium glycinendophyticum]|uniref:helix-turn-helix domain-containing protein n=1 Tax=Rhizobium glycinendophyticum TaxID=2589807 RepID=UPI003CCC8783